MALRTLLGGRTLEEAAERAEQVVASSEKLCKALESNERKMDALIVALNAHRDIMKEVADLMRGNA